MEERDIRSDMKRLQENVSELRVDFRRLDDKVDGVKDDVVELRTEMKDGFLALHGVIAALASRTAVLEEAVAALSTHFRESVAEIKEMIGALESNQRKLAWVGGSVCAFLLVSFGSAYAHLIERSDVMQRDLIARSDALRLELTARSDALAQETRASFEKLDHKISELQAATQ